MIKCGTKSFPYTKKGYIEAQKEAVMSHRPIIMSTKVIKQRKRKGDVT